MDYVFCREMRAEKKEDKINTVGTVQDLQVTNILLSICGQNAIIKLRSLISPRNLIETSYKDIRLSIQNCISPKEKVVTTLLANFLWVIHGVGESDDFLARLGLREEKRCCDFEKFYNSGQTQRGFDKYKVYLMFEGP